MKSLRQFLILIASLVSLVCIVLLLNFTAPNPTGRRYSSAMPLTTGEGSAQRLGDEGESVLAVDLRLPNNNIPGRKQCVCNSVTYSTIPPSECSVCFASSPNISNYRIPDFVGNGFFVEAKNARSIVPETRDYQQITDYVEGALVTRQTLWVYVRVNTYVDLQLENAVTATGGGIVRYFTVPGWVDPVDHAARVGLAAAGAVLIGVLYWEWVANRQRAVPPINRRRPTPTPKSTPSANGKPARTLDRAVKSTQDLETFKRRVEDKARREIDENDIWADPS